MSPVRKRYGKGAAHYAGAENDNVRHPSESLMFHSSAARRLDARKRASAGRRIFEGPLESAEHRRARLGRLSGPLRSRPSCSPPTSGSPTESGVGWTRRIRPASARPSNSRTCSPSSGVWRSACLLGVPYSNPQKSGETGRLPRRSAYEQAVHCSAAQQIRRVLEAYRASIEQGNARSRFRTEESPQRFAQAAANRKHIVRTGGNTRCPNRPVRLISDDQARRVAAPDAVEGDTRLTDHRFRPHACIALLAALAHAHQRPDSERQGRQNLPVYL